MERRQFVARNAALAAALTAPSYGCSGSPSPSEVTLRTADWLFAQRRELPSGVVWPVDAAAPDGVQSNLYSGTPGVVLFLTELFLHTGDQRFLDEARRGADHLAGLVHSRTEPGEGLYVGLGGIGFVLDQVGRAGDDVTYRDAAREAFTQVIDRAVPRGAGVAWLQGDDDNQMEVTDIVSGASGTVLALLYAHRELEVEGARDAAIQGGNRLVQLAESSDVGSRWAMEASFARKMPNFSHGTAGVAYTLARLYEEAPQPDFLRVGGERCLVSPVDHDARFG